MEKPHKKKQKGFASYKTDVPSDISAADVEKINFQPKHETNMSSTTKKWFEEFCEEPSEQVPLQQEEITKLRAKAKTILANEVTKHELKLSRTRQDHQWMRTVLARGTTSDKIAVHILLIQDSPLHSLASLDSLVGMAKVAKKKECVVTIETLTELFLSDLLPQDRKLRVFEACPLRCCTVGNNANLLHYYFEDQLKDMYRSFVEALNTASHDTVDTNKEKAIVAMYKLLSGCPEQEVLLLRNLVNKLGDPNPKIVSKVIYCLGQLLHSHPDMKSVVMEEIEKLLFRTNVSARAQYYCICFLSQFVFTNHDARVAKNLIKLYFSFFKACIKKGEVDSRMMSVLLMGVNRAYPFAKTEMQHISEHVETMYKVVHMANFNVSLHTLCLLYHVCDHNNSVSDRFYCALYKKIVDPGLLTSCHQAMFLSLLFRALRKDTHAGRVRAFVKRLLQVCLHAPVPLACGILYMTSQLVYRRSDLLALSCRASFLDDCDDDGDERYEDVELQESHPMEDEKCSDSQLETVNIKDEDVKNVTWLHCDNMMKTGGMGRSAEYNPLQRNPTFAGAEHTAYVELRELSQHFHPTVALFASNIVQGTLTHYSGDPLLDFTICRFLDRFVFKNPKKVPSEDMHIHPFDRKKKYVTSGPRALRVNSANYLNMEECNIPEDERFLYRYLYMRQARNAVDEGDDDAGSVASEEFEEMLDSLTGTKDGNQTLEFADHISAKGRSSKKDTKYSNEGSSSGEESTQENDEDFEDGDSEDDDGSDIVFDSDDNGSEEDIANELRDLQFLDEGYSRTSHGTKQKAKKKDDVRSMFASADEFAEILQNEGMSGQKGALSNNDNAGVKQLKWESARDFRLNMSDQKRRKREKGPVGKAKKRRRQ